MHHVTDSTQCVLFEELFAESVHVLNSFRWIALVIKGLKKEEQSLTLSCLLKEEPNAVTNVEKHDLLKE